jgi:uncharacterized protein YcfL
MSKQLITIALVALFAVGCRSVENNNKITLTAGKNINYTGESLQEGTQAADKEVGDISPSTSATVTPQ